MIKSLRPHQDNASGIRVIGSLAPASSRWPVIHGEAPVTTGSCLCGAITFTAPSIRRMTGAEVLAAFGGDSQ